MVLRVSIDTRKAMRTLGIATRAEAKRFDASVQRTAQAVAQSIEARGRNNILNSGDFSRRWVNNFLAEHQRQGRDKHLIRVGFTDAIPYAHVHEFGATMRGRPFMWLPVSSWNRIRLRNWMGGRLVRINRPGKSPILFSVARKMAAYVGVRFVTLRPRFRIREITANVVRTQFARLFFDIWRRAR